MRISQIPNGQTPLTGAGPAQLPLTLTPGQRLIVTVLANDSGLLQLLAEGNADTARTLVARTELPLQPGQRLQVVVAGADNAQIILRLADGQGVLAPVTPEAIAQALALPADQPWPALLTTLIRDSLPLTRELAEQVMTLWHRSNLPEPEPAALLWLSQRGINPTPERVALVKAFRHAHQGRGEPPADAIMATVDVPGENGPMQFSIWVAGLDAPAVEPDPHGRKHAGGDGRSDADDQRSDEPEPAERPAVVLLSVQTPKLGAVEALVEVSGESVTVTCFSENSDAVLALAGEIGALRASLAAAGLVPKALAARSPEAARDVSIGIRRLDVRI